MANWIEQEEERKKLEEEKRAQVRIENDKRAKDFAYKYSHDNPDNIIIKSNLKSFRDLCDRVRKLGHNVHWFPINNVQYSVKHNDSVRAVMTEDNRSISFSLTNSGDVLIEVSHNHLIYKVFSSENVETKTVIFNATKNCLLQDLPVWQEEKMLIAIDWLMSKNDSITTNLPGENQIVTYIEANNVKSNSNNSFAISIFCGIVGFVVGKMGGILLALILAIIGFFIGLYITQRKK